jgi:predicted glycogen debranching enzyme
VRLYENAGGSRERLDDELYPALVEIARTYLDGRSDLARIDAGGLLVVGGPEQNATWMDARTAAGPVTPRDGCPVEIEALWYQLLAMLEADSARRGDEARAREWGTRKRLAGKTFLRRLWLEDDRYLADVWHPETGADRSLRPNQVLAAALEFSPLSPGRRSDVVRWMDIELRTPFGLRTLAPQDPRYVGHYVGTQDARDSAYHQGTVWPWLLGAYVEAFLRVHPSRRRKIEELRASLDVFRAHLDAHGLNQVSEVFDADPPHAPGGTFAQAWSVAELLRAVRLLDGALS